MRANGSGWASACLIPTHGSAGIAVRRRRSAEKSFINRAGEARIIRRLAWSHRSSSARYGTSVLEQALVGDGRHSWVDSGRSWDVVSGWTAVRPLSTAAWAEADLCTAAMA
jgi:hypothetical protein